MYFYIKSILLYKDQVCGLKVLWTGMGGVGGLGAKATEGQGLERIHAPSQVCGDGEWYIDLVQALD